MFETSLGRIKELAEQKKRENSDFRDHLKSCDIEEEEIDAIVHRLDAYVSSKIDCRQCANCCRELQAALGREDVARLAKAEGITREQFEHKYLDKTDEPDRLLIRQKPCPFLAGKLCRYYQLRPESCAEFPFLHKPDFTTRSMMALWNLPYCPIVYNVYELLKSEIAELEMLRRDAKEEDLE
ncbi:YkgJ family cysteine cluster protein [candidate division WOR-3 bacterium]|uniref:YkgJ family cysteine cluster protein n=1 Tax=candidate division WOR-3 bacterium TaxID=2052148 RepID=A0A937XCM0_UNCW3|nr:YkgJ family cysteine cluster protein [candidate division WOR-3 bacterium]